MSSFFASIIIYQFILTYVEKTFYHIRKSAFQDKTAEIIRH
jgi:hypothetical protein